MSDDLFADIGGPDAGSNSKRVKTSYDPNDFGAYEDALSDAAKRANAAWLALIATLSYFLIAAVKITHRDLFLERPVKLPLLNVDMPLAYFGIAAPLFITAFHLFALLMIEGLRDKISAWNESIKQLARIKKDRERFRQRLDTSLLAQAFGADRGFYKQCLMALAWTTMVLAPLLSLLLVQIVFLPYQGREITDFQRAVLLFDCGVVIALSNWRFLTIGISAVLIVSSLFVLVFPNHPRSYLPFIDTAIEATPPFRNFLRDLLVSGPDLVHRGSSRWLSNRLVLPDQNLAVELGKEGSASSLRGRRLASAILDRSDLHGVDFTGADLREASLQGTQLQKAVFECAETGADTSLQFRNTEADVQQSGKGYSEPLRAIGCAMLHGARMDGAKMEGASLLAAYLAGASAQFTDFSHASLGSIQAQGASFENAQLTAVTLDNAQLDGASFKNAEMELANLRNVRAPGASFDEAILFAADLSRGFFSNASFRGSQIQAANVNEAVFERSLFLGVATYGADPRGATFVDSVVINIDHRMRWDPSYGGAWFDLYASETFVGFQMEGDRKYGKENEFSPYPDKNYYDKALFERREQITEASVDNLMKSLGSNAQGQPNYVERLQRLRPQGLAADEDRKAREAWAKLNSESRDEKLYQDAYAARIEHIACLKPSNTRDLRFDFAPHIARALLRANRFDDAGCHRQRIIDKLRSAMKAGAADGLSQCAGAQGLEEPDFFGRRGDEQTIVKSCEGQ